MFHVFLTQAGGPLGPIITLLGWIINGIYEFLSLFGIQNVGIVIILFTFIIRGFMIPITIKQQRFSKLSSVMNPEIQKVQSKYKGKKDEASLRKQQAETSAIYEKYGANPTAGCLPLLITIPIMYALYRVIYNIPAYINDIRAIYNNIAVAVMGTSGYIDILSKFADAHHVKLSVANGAVSANNIIDVLSKFNQNDWEKFTSQFPQIKSVIDINSSQILSINALVGKLSVIDQPGYKFPGIIIPLLAAGLQYVQSKLMTFNTPTDSNNPMAASMKSMNIIMPIMSGFFCLTLQAGIGLYWIAGSAFSIVQQIVINRHLDRMDMEVLIKKNVEKANKKKAKKGIKPTSMEELAKTQTKSIDIKDTKPEIEEKKSISSNANSVKKNYEPSNYKKSDVSYSSKSIAANANLLRNRNNEKGDK